MTLEKMVAELAATPVLHALHKSGAEQMETHKFVHGLVQVLRCYAVMKVDLEKVEAEQGHKFLVDSFGLRTGFAKATD